MILLDQIQPTAVTLIKSATIWSGETVLADNAKIRPLLEKALREKGHYCAVLFPSGGRLGGKLPQNSGGAGVAIMDVTCVIEVAINPARATKGLLSLVQGVWAGLSSRVPTHPADDFTLDDAADCMLMDDSDPGCVTCYLFLKKKAALS